MRIQKGKMEFEQDEAPNHKLIDSTLSPYFHDAGCVFILKIK